MWQLERIRDFTAEDVYKVLGISIPWLVVWRICELAARFTTNTMDMCKDVPLVGFLSRFSSKILSMTNSERERILYVCPALSSLHPDATRFGNALRWNQRIYSLQCPSPRRGSIKKTADAHSILQYCDLWTRCRKSVACCTDRRGLSTLLPRTTARVSSRQDAFSLNFAASADTHKRRGRSASYSYRSASP
ncbi:hypothetical protein A0H81_05014 [Grifola frondosa]|uniref:Uncharacterized protein n=1 Tax=Grifola frondosa TaxID=5627 RepID=A0A1C7MG70_GRIFR|nr:hypothetical protein A0H81_05014 [Grifola frondosa]